jgi:hypothetical protein
MEERTRRAGELAYLIYRQWWRLLKNRQRRRELAGILEADEREYRARSAPSP